MIIIVAYNENSVIIEHKHGCEWGREKERECMYMCSVLSEKKTLL